MGAIIGFLISNPLVILAIIGTFVATGVASDVKGWVRERQVVTAAVKPWVAAVDEQKTASRIKEQIAIEAIQARENAKNEIATLQTQLEAAELERKAKGAIDCPWTDDDLRMLNDGRGANGRKKTSSLR